MGKMNIGSFWHFLVIFLPIFIPRQFVISPYSNIFDWSSGLGGDRSGRTPDTIVTQHMEKILVRYFFVGFSLMKCIFFVVHFHVKDDFWDLVEE